MNWSHPLQLVSHPLDGRVLEILAGADAWMTTGQISRVARDVSERGVRAAADRLRLQGILVAQPAGKAVLYRLNRDHLASSHVIGLAHLWFELVNRLKATFAEWNPRPVAAYLFGSVGRRDGTAQSDIDMLLIRPDVVDGDNPLWVQQRDRLVVQVGIWTGNDTRIVEYRAGEALALIGTEPLLTTVGEEAVALAGDLEFLTPGP